MIDIICSWPPNPPAEQISEYAIFMDGLRTAPAQSPYTFLNVPVGLHTFEVAPIGPWGEGPKSDPVSTPPGATKPLLTIDIRIRVNA